jgi:hypothetical protein
MNPSQVSNLLKRLGDSEEKFSPNEDDSLFNIVSKAYKRNYSKVLNRNKQKSDETKGYDNKSQEMNDKTKQEFKSLLE